MNVAVMDVYSRLMMDRIIFMGYPVTDEVANIITAQFLFLESTDRTKDIQMYINSPGGNVYAGLGMYDTMHTLNISQLAQVRCLLYTTATAASTPHCSRRRISQDTFMQPQGTLRTQRLLLAMAQGRP